MKQTNQRSIRGSINSLVVTMITLLVGASLIGAFARKINPKHAKRGMLGNLIGGIIVIFVGVSLIGIVSQEMQNAFCGSKQSSSLFETIADSSDEAPIGSTDSFGGGGAEHFGGYDGKVEHKNWLANLAPIKSDESMFFSGENCIDANSAAGAMLNFLPLFFGLAIAIAAIMMVSMALRNGGMV